MTGIVVEVGPATVRGPNHADAEWVSAGIDGIDDELTLIDDRPVEVADVWRSDHARRRRGFCRNDRARFFDVVVVVAR